MPPETSKVHGPADATEILEGFSRLITSSFMKKLFFKTKLSLSPAMATNGSPQPLLSSKGAELALASADGWVGDIHPIHGFT